MSTQRHKLYHQAFPHSKSHQISHFSLQTAFADYNNIMPSYQTRLFSVQQMYQSLTNFFIFNFQVKNKIQYFLFLTLRYFYQYLHIFIFVKMSDHYFTSPYPYETKTRHHSLNRGEYQPYQGKISNKFDIDQSNISQQTIIHKARLYSPIKNQQYGFKYNYNQINERTKTKKQTSNTGYNGEVRQFGGILSSEKDRRGFFQEAKESKNKLPSLDLSGVIPDYDRGTTFGPIRHPNSIIPKAESRQITPREAYGDKQTAARDNIYKKSAIEDLKTDRNAQEAGAQQTPDLREHVSQQDFYLSEGAYEMIEQIERKAMDEIESLRRDKIQLMRKLNEEIRAHNQEKKLRIRLENQLAKVKSQNLKPQVKSHSQPHFTPAQHYFKQTQPQQIQNQPCTPYQTLENAKISPIPRPQVTPIQPILEQNEILYEKQINRLKNQSVNAKRIPVQNAQGNGRQSIKQELRRQIAALNGKINQYQFQLQRLRSNKSPDVLQAQSLLQQGERIKFETLRLLKQHDYESENANTLNTKNRPTRDHQSNQVLQDMQNFKRRLVQLEEQNQKLKVNLNKGVKKDFEQGFGGRASYPVKSKPPRNQNNIGNRMREFEQIIGDLKSAAR